MTEHPKPAKRWLRFSLGTLLFVSLCIGGVLGGYQSGYLSGYNSGQATRYDDTQATETYSTMNLIWPDLPPDVRAAEVGKLKDLIQSTIATEVWVDGSGNEVRDFSTNQSLIITAPGWAHRHIRKLFAQLDSLQNNGANDLLPVLQSLASQGKPQISALPNLAPKNSQAAHAWLKDYFRRTVDGVSDKWCAPVFQGECTDAAFPDWSSDQQIATWPRGNGVVFLGLRYLQNGQLHLVAGWREES